jgi:CubicO group peptidase (beta-lactamase class C family)
MPRKQLITCLALLLGFANVFSQTPAGDHKVQSLIDRFRDSDPFVNGEAISQLAQIGGSATDALIKSLEDANANVRWCSSIALEKIAPAGKQAIPFLIKALADSNSDVRWCCALALGKYSRDAGAAVMPLRQRLYDEDRDVRWAAYVSLGKIDCKAIDLAPEFSAVIGKLENLTPPLMKELHVPGVSIALVKDDQVAWSKSFGWADSALQSAADSTTAFEACSMSKPVFAYLALKLVDQGKLDLDEPLCRYLPEAFIRADAGDPNLMTARMVLTHTTGLPNWRKGGEEREGPLPLYFKPGRKFSYSGEGIYYLQRVVEHLTGEPLNQLAKQMLFDPLGLSLTSYTWTEKLSPRIATGHNASGKPLPRSKYLHANAAYTLYTTPVEYARLMVAILNTHSRADYSLSLRMQKEMTARQLRVEVRDVMDRPGRFFGLEPYRGLGWAVDATATHDVLYHSGANQTGFRCYAQFCPHDGSGIVIMANGLNGGELWSRLISTMGDW